MLDIHIMSDQFYYWISWYIGLVAMRSSVKCYIFFILIWREIDLYMEI